MNVSSDAQYVASFWTLAQPVLVLVLLAGVALILATALARRTSRRNSTSHRLSILQEAVESISSQKDRQEMIRTTLSFASAATGAQFAALSIDQGNDNSTNLYSLYDDQFRIERVGLATPGHPPPSANGTGPKRKSDRAVVYQPNCVIPTHYPHLTDPIGTAIRTSYGEAGELFVYNKSEPFTSEDECILALLADQLRQQLELKALLQQINHGYMETIEALVNAIEAKDAYTRGHSDRVTKYAVAIGHEMELPPEQIEEIRVGAVLHDIGKIGVPEQIINKPGRLDDDEWRLMKDHPRTATKIIDSFNRSREILLMIYHHHEMYDGTGYPAGLRGNEIPLAARILKVADAFEAMTSHRPYQGSKTVEEATKELKDWSGRQFDPLVVSAFIRALRNQTHELDLNLVEA